MEDSSVVDGGSMQVHCQLLQSSRNAIPQLPWVLPWAEIGERLRRCNLYVMSRQLAFWLLSLTAQWAKAGPTKLLLCGIKEAALN